MSKSTTTANPALQGSKEVTQAEIDSFDLSPHLIRLMWDEPFFARVIRNIQKIKTTQIPTAGVLAKDGEVKFWWNPKFLASLKADEVKGLIKHECYHLVFEHTTTRRHDPHIIWNTPLIWQSTLSSMKKSCQKAVLSREKPLSHSLMSKNLKWVKKLQNDMKWFLPRLLPSLVKNIQNGILLS